MRVLAGDIGGTKTALVLFDTEASPPARLREERYPSTRYTGLLPIVDVDDD